MVFVQVVSRKCVPREAGHISLQQGRRSQPKGSSRSLYVQLFQTSGESCCLPSRCPTITSPQIDALLPNVRPKDSRKQLIDKFLFSLHACLSNLPSVEPLHPLVASRALSEGLFLSRAKKRSLKNRDVTPPQIITVPYPLPVPTEDANWKVAFDKPANMAIVGSWINNVSVKRTDDEPWIIDVVVEMPPARLSSE